MSDTTMPASDDARRFPTGLKRADLQLALAAFLAGSGWLFSIHALQGLPPLLFIGSRFLLAGLIVALFADLRRLRHNWRECGFLVLSSAAMALAMTGWIIGLKHTSNPGVAAFITATGNLLVPVVGAMFFRWVLPSGLWLQLLMALCGMGFLFLDTASAVESTHLLFVVSACLWAISIALVKNGTAVLGTTTVATTQLILSGLLILVASLCVEQFPMVAPSLETAGWFLLSVLLSTCLRFFMQFQGQQAATPGRAAVLMSFEPIWTMVLSMAFLGASLSLMQAVGCAIIFVAVTKELFAKERHPEKQTS